MREVGLENFVHAVVVVDLGEEHGELQNAIHTAAAGFDQSLYALHNVFGVIFDVHGELALIVGVRANPGDVNHAVVNDERGDEGIGIGGLTINVEFLDRASVLFAGRCFRG